MHKYYRTKSIEESVEWAKKVQARKAGFVLWGRQYDTLNDIAKAFGLNTGSLRVRDVQLCDNPSVTKFCFKFLKRKKERNRNIRVMLQKPKYYP